MIIEFDAQAFHTSFALPQSMTYRIPGMVRDVSATLVATTTKRVPVGGGSNTFICFSVGNNEYNGMICIGADVGAQMRVIVKKMQLTV
jgi:hypothetical protein